MFSWFTTKKKEEPRSPEHLALEAFLNNLLKDENINTILPDKIEKDVYMKMLKLIIGVLRHTADTIHVDVLNHRITLHIEPIPSHSNV